MTVSKPLAAFYVVAALTLILVGGVLLIAPENALAALHGDIAGLNTGLSQQVGLGLLLASTVTLVCLLGGRQRLPLHLAVLLYLTGLAASHSTQGGSHVMWIWAPAALFLLALLPLRRLIPARASLGGSNQQRGEVKWFNPNKGFGFILTDQGEELFVHFKAVQNGGRRSLRTGTRVRFDTRMSERGEQADNVYIEQ